MIDEFHGGSVADAGDDADAQQRTQQDEQQFEEEAFEFAMQLLLGGQGVEQILSSGDFAQVPEHIKQKIRARLQQAAAEREMRQHEMAQQTREQQTEKRSAIKLFTLGMMSGLISKVTFDKINALFTQQPHLQQQVRLQGENLLRAGAQPDVEFAKSTVQIAVQAPATPSLGQGQGQLR